MNIIERIKQSVIDATGVAFYYDTPQTLNLRLDSATLPCAMLQVVESGAVVDQNGTIRERLTVSVLFCNTTDLDFDGLQNEEILQTLKFKAFRWVFALQAGAQDLRLVSLGNTHRYYAADDLIYTAFAVDVTLEELYGQCRTDEEETDDDGDAEGEDIADTE